MGTCLIQKLVLLFLLFTFCIFFTGWLNFSRFLDVSFTIPLLSLYLIARGKTGDTRYGVPVKRCITGGGLVSVPFAFGIEDKTPHISLGHKGKRGTAKEMGGFPSPSLSLSLSLSPSPSLSPLETNPPPSPKAM